MIKKKCRCFSIRHLCYYWIRWTIMVSQWIPDPDSTTMEYTNYDDQIEISQ